MNWPTDQRIPRAHTAAVPVTTGYQFVAAQMSAADAHPLPAEVFQVPVRQRLALFTATGALFYLLLVKCDFHVEGSTTWWSAGVVELPEIGDTVEHSGKRYTVIEVAVHDDTGPALVVVRLRVDELALV